MDVLASEVGTRPPWGLLFADDLAICAESSTEVEDELEKWRRVLEENGLKINRKKIIIIIYTTYIAPYIWPVWPFIGAEEGPSKY